MTTRPRTALVVLSALTVAAAACTGDPKSPTTAEESAETPAVVWGSNAERTIYLWDPTTGHAGALITKPAERAARLDDAEQSPDGTQVVFERQVSDLPSQIYVLEADGTERQLTDFAGGAFDPAWSPDGTTVAFSGSRVEGSDLDIYTVDLAGGTERRIARTWKDDGHPDWSPDGAQIVFDSRSGDLRSGTGAIWVTSTRTDELHRLTPRGTRYAETVPAWSPDGRWIAYRAYVEGVTLNDWPWTARLWLMRPDGSGRQRIGGHSGDRRVIHAPSWSPDGRSIVTQRSNWREDAFEVVLFDPRTREAHRILEPIDDDAEPSWGADGILLTLWSDDAAPTEPAPPRFRVRAQSIPSTEILDPAGPDLYQLDPTTGQLEPILSAAGGVEEPEVSPDGWLVVYQGFDRDGIPQIFVLEGWISRGAPRRYKLTDLPGGALDPTWSPDGTQIAFAARDRSSGSDSTVLDGYVGETDIFVMDADGRHVRRLIGTPRPDRRPDWSPDGETIAFDADGEVWVGSVDGSELRRLKVSGNRHDYGGAADPAWSPDGRWIAFTRFHPVRINGILPHAVVWVMRSDGTDESLLLPTEELDGTYELDPSWSPDGASIVFASGRDASRIGIVEMQTREVVYLETDLAASDLSWSVDGIVASMGYLARPSPNPLRG